MRCRWCNRITSATIGVATSHQIVQFMRPTLSPTLIYFPILLSPICGVSQFGCLCDHLSFRFNISCYSIALYAAFQYLAPNLLQNCQKEIPLLYLTHATTNVWFWPRRHYYLFSYNIFGEKLKIKH